ncbi:Phosphoglucosamine mutase [Candidatus Kinetoplastibacterium sorsogonicusi]|uniref:Phosphoglucosamine mutase n=1 Tax=Candidatus Kinetoplastidibacterium kentomonadis TaxID=1576550 RepID=A0A3Q8F6B8_9PROT|nr:phosphoglucosamine mutase [Candidatus Kinetoplastibacterium sorsogonicusi]AWD32285.1 Phosphoglucosamine mutase [Candidatus Kinetoplastibacterium sorsogonicusi]
MSKMNYFGTDGIRGQVGGDLINTDFIFKLGYAFGVVLNNTNCNPHNKVKVVIGKDTRISSDMLENSIVEGLISANVDVFLAGVIPTSAIAYISYISNFSAGIVISASHNHYLDNGIKFFSGNGSKLSLHMEAAIEKEISNPVILYSKKGIVTKISNIEEKYIDFCKSTFPNNISLKGIKLVIDSANGSAYKIAPYIFNALGANVFAIGSNPNGKNINDKIGSIFPDTLKQVVISKKADLGIAFDGDADRVLMIDSNGRIFNGDELLYSIVIDRLSYNIVNGVVGTLMTNYGFEKQMHKLHIKFYRTNVGDRNVIETMKLYNCLYGGENSGHLICLDRHSTGDGIISSLQILAAIIRHNQSISSFIKDLYMYPQYIVNVPWNYQYSWEKNNKILIKKQEIEKKLSNRGRVLIRNSGTEPKLRLMVEAADKNLALSCIQELKSIFD